MAHKIVRKKNYILKKTFNFDKRQFKSDQTRNLKKWQKNKNYNFGLETS